jgi:hypothetical protein
MAPRLKIVRIPRTPSTAFDKHRPISDLVRNQVRHAHQELHEWWESLGRIEPDEILTEQQAADYLRAVTRVLHPEGARHARVPAGRPARSGVWLGEPQGVARPARRRARKTRRARR